MSKHEAPPAVGGSSLLVIFAVLCLTIFALLSLSTVQADGRMAEASYKAVQDFYEADAEAERILAKLRQGDLPDNVTKEGNLYRYTCQVSELQALEVRWQMVSTTQWEADDSMNVWDGSME